MASLLRYARRIMGRRLTWAAYNAMATVARGLRLVDPSREGRPLGISATVIVYNDPDWLPLALEDAASVADEVLVVDSSDPWDETEQVLEDARSRLGVRVVRQYPPRGYAEARELALRESRYRYILVWDSDFIAFEGLGRALRDFVEGEGRDRYVLLYWPFITLCGDLSHRCRADRLHEEHWAFTYSRRLRYLWDGRFEYLYAPPYYFRRRLSSSPMGLHLTGVRRPERVAVKRLMPRADFYSIASTQGVGKAMEAVRAEARRLYGTDDLREVGLRIMEEDARGRPCFDVGLLPSKVLRRAREIGVPLGSCGSNA
ncbi:glycosyl transferase family 2 [Acidilobus saccharovorans 345-15]|uniref:Glycosyl transferase family 2 n=1 Tax=Acidilobus saccharovorans (strain DSM 16705 / JCM 18335 / VKM B-2471 / 345-15) TaxID=666510 RepID=D9PZI9_ACIS3|nr:glycosyltransferase [Acidilobus saccharovorans]ADL18477.1 glycosyl transferase family 2 [Acidilobus saccharovorans 345-15]